jgi:hypothetical protein
MPLPITRGAASAKAFGWTRNAGAAGFKFMGQQSIVSSNVRGGTTVAAMTQLPTQPTTVTLKAVGLAVDGSFIAQAGNQYSTNGGASWLGWMSPGSTTPTGMPGGINGGIAYNPTAKRALTFTIEYFNKGSYFYARIFGITSTGSSNSYEGPNVGGTPTVYNIIYSPTLNNFYLMNYGASLQSNYYANGTTGAAGGTAAGGNPGSMRAGISHNGYPLGTAYAGFGTTFYLREYTAADFSTYNQFGGVEVGNSNAVHSPFFWAPVNNKYLAASAPSNGGTISIYAATSGSPAVYTNIAGFSASGAVGYITSNFIEEANGTIWIFGQYSVDVGKGQRVTTNYTWYTTDGGFQWFPISPATHYVALAKNFTP